MDDQQTCQTSAVLWMVLGPKGHNVIKTADLGSSMDGFGTVRKRQPKSQISMVLSLSLSLGPGICLTTKHVEKHMQPPNDDQYVL